MTIDLKAYELIYADEKTAHTNIALNINTNTAEIREAFARAMAGEHVITAELAKTISGQNVKLYLNSFTKPGTAIGPEPYDFSDAARAVVALEGIAEQPGKNLTGEQKEELNERYSELAQITGIEEAAIRKIFNHTTEDISLKTDEDVERGVEAFNKMIVDFKTSAGMFLQNGNTFHVAVARFETEDSVVGNGLPGSDRDDPAPVKFPVSKEVQEFIFFLHENEHVATEGSNMSPTGPASETAMEADADTGVLNFLKENGMAEAREYYLNARTIDGFKMAFIGDYEHDTATFLRVLDATGRQIDIAALIEHKEDLVERLAGRLGYPEEKDKRQELLKERFDQDKRIPSCSEMMGALRAILADDKTARTARDNIEDYNSRDILHDVEREEARQFLQAAEALGYVATDDYVLKADSVVPASEAPAPNVVVTKPQA